MDFAEAESRVAARLLGYQKQNQTREGLLFDKLIYGITPSTTIKFKDGDKSLHFLKGAVS